MTEYEKGRAEQVPEWEAPKQEPQAEVDNEALERMNQSRSSRLCEFVTGMKPENPDIIKRLEEDQKIIRGKYNLPDTNLPPSEFERSLKQLAKKHGVQIRLKHEYSRLFDAAPGAAAMYLEGGKMVIGIDQSSLRNYKNSLKLMEHELVHGIQEKYAASMPIEMMEYEAYVANGNLDMLGNDPEAVKEILFETLIGGSVDIYYDLEGKRRGEKMSPVWDNPDYFLEKDAQTKVEQQ